MKYESWSGPHKVRTLFAWFFVVSLPSLFVSHLPLFLKFYWCEISQRWMYSGMVIIGICICKNNLCFLIVCKLVWPKIFFFQCFMEWFNMTVLLWRVMPDEFLLNTKNLDCISCCMTLVLDSIICSDSKITTIWFLGSYRIDELRNY